MNATSSQTTVVEIERLLKSHRGITAYLREETAKSPGLTDALTSDAIVKIHATIEKQGESKGVVKVAEFSAAELYRFSGSPTLEFNRAVAKLSAVLAQALEQSGDVVASELAYTDFWKRAEGLKSFFGLSSPHDELISVVLGLVRSEAIKPATPEKLNALLAVFSIVREKVAFSDDTLNEVEDILECAQFDLNAPLGF